MRSFFSPLRTIGMMSVATALLATTAGQSRAQVDNFNDGNDTGWTRYDPISSVAGPQATFSFPNGNSYRLQTNPSPAPGQVGPGRAGSIRNDTTFSGFYTAVDFGPFAATLPVDQAFGILARMSSLGLGTTNGYSFTYATDGPSIDITRITGEQPTGFGGASAVTLPFALDPTHKYRLVFAGAGSTLKGKVYDLDNPSFIIGSASLTDATYASGNNGLLVFDNSSGGNQITDATFDNYIATIPGDANADGRVTVGDLGILATNFNQAGKDWEQGDFNLDGSVTVGDLGILATNFGLSVPGAPAGLNEPTFKEAMAMPQFAALAGAVPEPASLSLALFGLAAFARRRSR